MSRGLVWSDSARDEFFEAIRYIAERHPEAAERVASLIDRTAMGLTEFTIGRPGRVAGTFEKVVRGLPYILAYEIVTDTGGTETVAILRLVHGARDWRDEDWPRP